MRHGADVRISEAFGVCRPQGWDLFDHQRPSSRLPLPDRDHQMFVRRVFPHDIRDGGINALARTVITRKRLHGGPYDHHVRARNRRLPIFWLGREGVGVAEIPAALEHVDEPHLIGWHPLVI